MQTPLWLPGCPKGFVQPKFSVPLQSLPEKAIFQKDPAPTMTTADDFATGSGDGGCESVFRIFSRHAAISAAASRSALWLRLGCRRVSGGRGKVWMFRSRGNWTDRARFRLRSSARAISFVKSAIMASPSRASSAISANFRFSATRIESAISTGWLTRRILMTHRYCRIVKLGCRS